MKVIIATDGSTHALAAARAAVTLFGSAVDLEVVVVIPPPDDPIEDAGGIEGSVLTPEEAAAIREHNVHDAEAAVAATEAVIDATGPHQVHEVILNESNVGHSICQYAATHEVDVIVMGESEKGWFRRLLEGSAVNYVVSHAPCPVLIVPATPA